MQEPISAQPNKQEKTIWEKHVEKYGIYDDRPETAYAPYKSFLDREAERLGLNDEEKHVLKKAMKLKYDEDRRKAGISKREIAAMEHNRKVMMSAREREWQILEMRLDQCLTLEQIASRLDPPVTRERVRQILANFSTREGIILPRVVTKPKDGYERTRVRCSFDGCNTAVIVTKQRADKGGTIRCEEHRKKSRKWFNADGSKMTHNEIARWKYHNDPNYKANRELHSLKYYNKIKHTDHHKNQQKEYSKRYIEAHKKDPAWMQKQREAAHRQYLKAKVKPGFKEKERARTKRSYEKLKAERLAKGLTVMGTPRKLRSKTDPAKLEAAKQKLKGIKFNW